MECQCAGFLFMRDNQSIESKHKQIHRRNRMKLKVKTVDDGKVKGVIITAESLMQLHAFSKNIPDKNVKQGFTSLVDMLHQLYEQI